MNISKGVLSSCFLTILFFSFVFFSISSAEEYSLEDLYRFALERSEKMKISDEDMFIAERGRDKALSVLFPKLSTFGSYTGYSTDKFSSSGAVIQPDNSMSWGLRLDQSFSMSGRELTALQISKESVAKSRFDIHAVREDYLLTVSAVYYEVLRGKKALEIAQANVERLTKHRDASSIRLKVGEVTKTALLRAEAELSGAQSEEIRVRNGLELSRVVLARITGLNGGFDVREGNSQPDGMAVMTADCKLQAIDCLKQTAFSGRAELRGLEIQKGIAEAQVRYTRGSYWPTFSIEGVYSGKDDEPASSMLNKESVYAGLRINFPFFEGGLRKAEVSEAEARSRQAVLLYEDRKKSVGVEVENAYLELKTMEGVLEKFESQVIYAKDNYKAVSKQFEFGLANSIDVMDANTLLVTAERQLSDSKYIHQMSLLRLKRATGMLLKSAMSQIK